MGRARAINLNAIFRSLKFKTTGTGGPPVGWVEYVITPVTLLTFLLIFAASRGNRGNEIMKELDASFVSPASAQAFTEFGSKSSSHGSDRSITIPTLRVDEPANDDDKSSYPERLNLVSLYDKARQSVVEIDGRRELDTGGLSPVRPRGSGFFVDGGQVATVLHVVHGVKDLSILTCDGKRYPAGIVAEDAEHDLAVLKVNAPGKPHFKDMRLGYSDYLQKDAELFGFGFSGPAGKLFYSPGTFLGSGELGDLQPGYKKFLKYVNGLETMLHVNAHCERGASGEPLLDASGGVVGIVDMANAKDDVVAVPVEQVKRLLWR